MFGKKKQEKKTLDAVSLADLQVKVSKINMKLERAKGQFQEMNNKYIEKATNAMLAGKDASRYTDRIALVSEKINKVELMQDQLQDRLDDITIFKLDGEFVSCFTDISKTFSEYSFGAIDTKAAAKIIDETNSQLAAQQAQMKELLDATESFTSMGINDTSGAKREVANNINNILKQTIHDCQLDPNATPETIAERVKEKLKV